MIKRERELTPRERRAKRIRFSLYTGFAAFLLALLLTLAWIGASAAHRNPPHHLEVDPPADGYLVFDVDECAAAARRVLSGDNARLSRFLGDEAIAPLTRALGPKGEIFFWRDEGDHAPAWLCFVPIDRPQRGYVEAVRRALEDSQVFRPLPERIGAPTTENDGVLGFYEVSGKGLLVTSQPRRPAFRVVEGTAVLTEGVDSYYRGEGGYLPEFLRRAVLQDEETDVVQRLELHWRSPRGNGAGSVEVRRRPNKSEAASVTLTETIGYFDPLVPAGADSKKVELP